MAETVKCLKRRSLERRRHTKPSVRTMKTRIFAGNTVPTQPLVAASGAWSANDVFNVKLVLYQTPFYSALTFKFDGDGLLFDAEHNVSFGPRNLPPLIGQAASTR